LDSSSKLRAICFFDGQNLFHRARQLFDISYPSYDVVALSQWVCTQKDWNLDQVRFYTGVPSHEDNAVWHQFWAAKLRTMRTQGVYVKTHRVKYHYNQQPEPGRPPILVRTGNEKQTDVSIAVDLLSMAYENAYDVAVLFSQDSDLTPAVLQVFKTAKQCRRDVFIASAFPSKTTEGRQYGVPHSFWIHIDEQVYRQCEDRRDYRRST
jgi:uncharacterized LabA/DUF88 family protein